MSTFPTPGGQDSTAPIGTVQGLTLQQYAADFDKKFPGKNAGQGFLDYAQAHPSLTPYQDAQAFALEIAFLGVDKAVANSIAELDKILQSTGPAAGKAAKSLSQVPGLTGIAAIGDFFAKLGEASVWLRIAEVGLGLILIAVGLARITHVVPIATKIAGAVA